MRLVVMDVDSTLIQGEVIEMLAAHAGFEPEVAAHHRGRDARRARLRGSPCAQRVALLEGLAAPALDEVYDAIVVAPGARTLVRTLRRLGYRFALVSGGFTQVTDRLAEDLGHPLRPRQRARDRRRRAHRPLVGPIVDRAGKAAALR